jgi:hypothetical protein
MRTQDIPEEVALSTRVFPTFFLKFKITTASNSEISLLSEENKQPAGKLIPNTFRKEGLFTCLPVP